MFQTNPEDEYVVQEWVPYGGALFVLPGTNNVVLRAPNSFTLDDRENYLAGHASQAFEVGNIVVFRQHPEVKNLSFVSAYPVQKPSNFEGPSNLESDYLAGIDEVYVLIRMKEFERAFARWEEVHQPLIEMQLQAIRLETQSWDAQVARVASLVFGLFENFYRRFPNAVATIKFGDPKEKAMALLTDARKKALNLEGFSERIIANAR